MLPTKVRSKSPRSDMHSPILTDSQLSGKSPSTPKGAGVGEGKGEEEVRDSGGTKVNVAAKEGSTEGKKPLATSTPAKTVTTATPGRSQVLYQ